MKKLRSIIILLVLLVFSLSLEMCTVKATSYCQKENQNINCKKDKNYPEKSSSDVFPDNDLIIKI